MDRITVFRMVLTDSCLPFSKLGRPPCFIPTQISSPHQILQKLVVTFQSPRPSPKARKPQKKLLIAAHYFIQIFLEGAQIT